MKLDSKFHFISNAISQSFILNVFVFAVYLDRAKNVGSNVTRVVDSVNNDLFQGGVTHIVDQQNKHVNR